VVDPDQRASSAAEAVLSAVRSAWQGSYTPHTSMRGFHDFQVTRGYLGVSL